MNRQLKCLLMVLACELFLTPILFTQTPTQPAQAAAEARALNAQVVKLYKEGKYQEAIESAKRALELWEKERGKDSEEAGTAALNLAEVYKAAKNFAGAENSYRRTLKIKEKLLGEDNPELCRIWINL